VKSEILNLEQVNGRLDPSGFRSRGALEVSEIVDQDQYQDQDQDIDGSETKTNLDGIIEMSQALIDSGEAILNLES